MSVQLSVSITDDNIAESNENFALIISSISLSNKISATNPHRANVTIVDNDG